MKTLAEVTRDASELAPLDRLKLAQILLSLPDAGLAPSQETDDAWDEEIQRRLQELRSGAVQGVPLEHVKKKIEEQFSS